jgi:uncharacterized protein YcbX
VYVAEIWRYPVKSMAGERLDHVEVGPLGLQGDRIVHVEDRRGRIVTARTHPRLLGCRASLDHAGEPRVNGRVWTEASVGAAVERIVGGGARLVRDESAGRFDILPLLVATDGAIAAFGYDGRRLRPNLVIGGVSGLDERSWPGSCLRIGEVVIGLEDLRGRCVMTTFDPDTLEQDRQVLTSIVQRFGGKLALNAAAIRGGQIREGVEVELVTAEACAESPATQPIRSETSRHPRNPIGET